MPNRIYTPHTHIDDIISMRNAALTENSEISKYWQTSGDKLNDHITKLAEKLEETINSSKTTGGGNEVKRSAFLNLSKYIDEIRRGAATEYEINSCTKQQKDIKTELDKLK
jgi:hypothetical protein